MSESDKMVRHETEPTKGIKTKFPASSASLLNTPQSKKRKTTVGTP